MKKKKKNNYTFTLARLDTPIEEYPVELQELLYEFAIGNTTVAALQRKFDISRRMLDEFLGDQKIKDYVLDIRKKASERIAERLSKLQIRALEVYEDLLVESKNDHVRAKAAKDLLSGLGIFKESSEVSGKVEVTIASELKKDAT